MPRLEKEVEKDFVDYIKKDGGLALKYELRKGDPDRLVLLPSPNLFFIEFKRKGEKPRKLQHVRMGELQGLGYSVYWTDDLEEAIRIYEEHKARC